MMKRLAVLTVLAFALAPEAHAQHQHRTLGPIELGIDGGVLFFLDDPRTTLVSFPTPEFRIGLLVSDKLELEPRFSLNSVHTQGGGSLTSYEVELGVLFMPSGDRVGKGLYLRPLIGVTGVNVSEFGNENSGYAGAGVGLKIPFADRRLATRMEGNYFYAFSNGGSNQIGLLVGLSFFSR